MSEKRNATFEKLSGQAKETIGKLTDNEKLQTQGTVEKTKGKIKESFDEAKNTVEGLKKGLSDK